MCSAQHRRSKRSQLERPGTAGRRLRTPSRAAVLRPPWHAPRSTGRARSARPTERCLESGFAVGLVRFSDTTVREYPKQLKNKKPKHRICVKSWGCSEGFRFGHRDSGFGRVEFAVSFFKQLCIVGERGYFAPLPDLPRIVA